MPNEKNKTFEKFVWAQMTVCRPTTNNKYDRAINARLTYICYIFLLVPRMAKLVGQGSRRQSDITADRPNGDPAATHGREPFFFSLAGSAFRGQGESAARREQ